MEYRIDRRAFYGLMAVLGVGLALGLGLLIGRMMNGEQAAEAPGVAPVAGGALTILDEAPITLNVDDPAEAVKAIEDAQAAPGSVQQPQTTLDYAALGIAADGELTPDQDATVARISIDEALPMLEDAGTVWVDTRSDPEFEQSHIKGAINVAAYLADDKLAELPKDKEIILYCA